jgi:hypothetical protein
MTVVGEGGAMSRLNTSNQSDPPALFDDADPNARQLPLSCIGSVEVSTGLVPIVPAEPEHEGAAPMPSQAGSDRELVSMWVARSASPHTRRNYRRHAGRFLAFVGRPLATMGVGDLQAHLNTLAERIMAEADTLRLIGLEPKPRNRALLTLLYGGGLRIAEVCGLRWRDLAEREPGGQATVYGKGGKTRVVLLTASTWRLLAELRTEAGADDPLFQSRRGGGPLNPSAPHRQSRGAPCGATHRGFGALA